MADTQAKVRSVSSDLRALLESADGADVTLVVVGSEFPAHSLILSARSPVFAAMLRNDMKEAHSRRIEIKDMREDVLHQVLSFIYTDTAPELGRVAAELLAAADKYDLPLLKERCEQRLAQDLTVENAVATAALAVMHRCPGLRDATVEFMVGHLEVMESAEWVQVLQENTEVAVEVCKQLAQARLPTNRKLTEEHRRNLAERLVTAASAGQTSEVRDLLQMGAPADAKAADGESALHKAVRNGQDGVVWRLIDAGADVNIRNASGRTPLHVAAQKSQAQRAIWTLLAASAHLNVKDNDGQTPLHLAASYGRVCSTKTLLVAGACRFIMDDYGKEAIEVATSETKPLFNTY